MQIDLPEVHAEVSGVCAAYERALVANDTALLDRLFWASGCTVRFGTDENLYGIDAIRAFRAARSPHGLERTLRRTVITTYGHDFATAMTEFVRPAFERAGRLERIGRQSQTWCRLAGPGPGGWRVVAAHVSVIAIDAAEPAPGAA
jgi:hypothetical protein